MLERSSTRKGLVEVRQGIMGDGVLENGKRCRGAWVGFKKPVNAGLGPVQESIQSRGGEHKADDLVDVRVNSRAVHRGGRKREQRGQL